MDSVYERRVWSSGWSSRPSGDRAAGKFVSDGWDGTKGVLPKSRHGGEHAEPPSEEAAESAEPGWKLRRRAKSSCSGGTCLCRGYCFCRGVPRRIDGVIVQPSPSGSWSRLRCGDAGSTGHCTGEVVSGVRGRRGQADVSCEGGER